MNPLNNSTIREAVNDWFLCRYDANLKWGPIDQWDTSQVTDMSKLFDGRTCFSADLSKWNTGNVTDMSDMFACAFCFSSDLSQWDTGNVTNMSYMFYDARHFDPNTILKWKKDKVIHWENMLFRTGVNIERVYE
jgi:hypothetical protein